MYNEILAYAVRENLIDLDFEMKNIQWIIQLDKDGKMSGPAIPNVETVKNDKNDKTREVVISLLVPYCDPNYISIPTNPEYYFLFGQPKVLLGDDEKESSQDKLVFVKRLLKEVGSHPHFKSILKLLGGEREKNKVLSDLKEQKIKPTDWFTFMVDGELVIKNEEVKFLWREYRKNNNTRVNNTPRFCHVTGQVKPCVDKFTKISSLPKLGAVDLVGFGKDSFNHYGLDGLTVGIEEDNRIKWGLYDLCKKGMLQGDILYIYWTKEKTSNFLDLNSLLNMSDSTSVTKLFQSPVKGKEYDCMDTNRYYLYGLTVRAGRLQVVESHTVSLNEIHRNLQEWFVRMGEQKYSIYRLIKSLEKENDSKGWKTHIWKNYYRQLLMSAVLNRPIPLDILLKAVDLELMQQVVSDKCNPVRMCLINLCIKDIDINSTIYQYGTLIGKYSNLHRLAMSAAGNKGKNYVAQMLRGLVNQPQSTFEILKGRFNGLRKFYSEKIDQKFPGRGSQLYREIVNMKVSVPTQLTSISERVEFLIGFNKETQ